MTRPEPQPRQRPVQPPLSEVWARLPHPARKRLLAVVEAEGRQVAAEVRRARGEAPRTAREAVAWLEAERAAVPLRRRLLETEYRMTDLEGKP